MDLFSQKAPQADLLESHTLIVTCAYNEEGALPYLLQELVGYDVLVIDDGSSDLTGTVAEARGARTIRHMERCGKAASLADALAYARENGYGTVVVLDADSMPDRSTVHKLLQSLQPNDVGAVSCMQIPLGPPSVSYRIEELMWATLARAKESQSRLTGSAHLGGVMYALKLECVGKVTGYVNDDERVGESVRRFGYKTGFAADATVYFDAATSIGHILQRRRRMNYGHMVFPMSIAPSMNRKVVLLSLLKTILDRPSRLVWSLPAVLLEIYSHLLAWRDIRIPQTMATYSRWVTTVAKTRLAIDTSGRVVVRQRHN